MLLTAILLAAAWVQPGSDDPFAVANYIRRHFGQPEMTRAEFDRQEAHRREDDARYDTIAQVEAGFRPADALARAGADVRRVRFGEPRLALRMPGVTLARTADGRVRVDLTSNGRAGTSQGFAPGSAWTELARLERLIDEAPASITGTRLRVGDPIRPTSVCHGWFATVEVIAGGIVRRTSAHGCDPSPRSRAAMAYAARVAAIAVAATPGCAPRTGGDAMDTLGHCYGRFAPHTTADP